MITVTAFTSCSHRLLTCSADMAAPGGGRSARGDRSRRGPGATTPGEGRRRCAGAPGTKMALHTTHVQREPGGFYTCAK